MVEATGHGSWANVVLGCNMMRLEIFGRQGGPEPSLAPTGLRHRYGGVRGRSRRGGLRRREGEAGDFDSRG